MNIVILGAGTVGTSIAEILCEQGKNVTFVDHSRRVLDEVEERIDVQTACGSASDAVSLFQAGAQSAELCLSVTNRDEVNLVGAASPRRWGRGGVWPASTTPTFAMPAHSTTAPISESTGC